MLKIATQVFFVVLIVALKPRKGWLFGSAIDVGDHDFNEL